MLPSQIAGKVHRFFYRRINFMKPSSLHNLKVYGVFGHRHMDMEIPELLLQEGSELEIQKRRYRIISIVRKGGNPVAVNVGLVH